jgi:hypothetical protein
MTPEASKGAMLMRYEIVARFFVNADSEDAALDQAINNSKFCSASWEFCQRKEEYAIMKIKKCVRNNKQGATKRESSHGRLKNGRRIKKELPADILEDSVR